MGGIQYDYFFKLSKCKSKIEGSSFKELQDISIHFRVYQCTSRYFMYFMIYHRLQNISMSSKVFSYFEIIKGTSGYFNVLQDIQNYFRRLEKSSRHFAYFRIFLILPNILRYLNIFSSISI